MQPLVIIVGPTAVGKSALGIELARALQGEIISGDSVQVYTRLDIGSAKSPLAERREIPHHLIDFLDPRESYTAAQFQKAALELIREIRERGHTPILVGGTGLYVRSILDPYDFAEVSTHEVRQKWLAFMEAHGRGTLHQELALRDPESAGRLHPNDYIRVLRALEIHELTGKPLSGLRQFADDSYKPLDSSIVYIGLTAPRELIYEKINTRCQEMLKEGLIEETLAILRDGYSSNLKPLQSIGYRHVIWYLKGYATKEEMLRLMKRDTRHFAKRQFTWFRRDPRIIWYDITKLSKEEIVAQVIKTCRG